MFLLGRHATLGQDPPMYFRSTTATRLPSLAKVHAAIVEPVPPPRITRSNSSGFTLLRTSENEGSRVLFIRTPFLDKRIELLPSHHLTGRPRPAPRKFRVG